MNSKSAVDIISITLWNYFVASAVWLIILTKQATGLDARASRVNAMHSLCRILMEYYLLNMCLKATICHIVMAKMHLIV